jgi:ribosomal protein S18 acetylase RimI-like enzyme
VHVRRARPEDYAAIGEVTLAAYAEFTRGRADPYVAKLADAETRDLEAELWVAVGEDDGEVLGSVTVSPQGSPWREIAVGDEGEFRMLAVAPSARGRGVGLALAQHCLERFREEGSPAVVLSSLVEMAAAHRLYARLGFARLPERDWSPLPGVDLIAFRKELA